MRTWNAMLSNVSEKNIDLTRIVAKAIARLSPATPVNFEVAAQKASIMAGIFDLLKMQDAEVLTHTVEALVDIARLNYTHMEDYLPQLFAVTQTLMAAANEPEASKVAGFALEVWNSLFEEEIERAKNAPADW